MNDLRTTLPKFFSYTPSGADTDVNVTVTVEHDGGAEFFASRDNPYDGISFIPY